MQFINLALISIFTLNWTVVKYFPHDVSFIVQRIRWTCFVETFVIFGQCTFHCTKIVIFLGETSPYNSFIWIADFIGNAEKLSN